MRSRQSGVIALCSTAAILSVGLVGAGPARADGGGDTAGSGVAVIGGGGTPSAGALPDANQEPNTSPRGRNTPQTKTAPQASTARRPSDFPVQGIDVASYQGNVDWAKAKVAGAKFVYAKATEGTTYYNPYFDQQYGGAKAHGLYAGAYVFARPDGNAVNQARYFYDHAQYVRDGRTMPLMLDLEGPYGSLQKKYDRCWNRSPSGMVQWIDAFVTTIGHRSGSPMLIYVNDSWWSQCTGNSKAFGGEYLNTAYWSTSEPTTLPASWTHWTVWQYTGSGGLPGVSGAVDRDVFYGSMAKLRRYAHRPVGSAQRLIPNDFNLDRHTDVGVFRPGSGNWWIRRDTGTTSQHFGTLGDIPLTWNSGDGWAKVAVFRPSTGSWYLADHLGNIRYGVRYGTSGDIPVPAHYRGIADSTVLAVYRPSEGNWYLRDIAKVRYGKRRDIPVPGHYRTDREHTDTIAVFRPGSGNWFLRGIGKFHFGERGDIPVPADYNGDGVTDIAVFRPGSGTWYIRGIGKYRYGTRGDIPLTGDFNGDGKAQPAVFRPSTNKFYIPAHPEVSLGSAGDIPIGAAPLRG